MWKEPAFLSALLLWSKTSIRRKSASISIFLPAKLSVLGCLAWLSSLPAVAIKQNMPPTPVTGVAALGFQQGENLCCLFCSWLHFLRSHSPVIGTTPSEVPGPGWRLLGQQVLGPSHSVGMALCSTRCWVGCLCCSALLVWRDGKGEKVRVRGFALTSAKQAALLLAPHHLLTGAKSFSWAGSVGELWLFTAAFAREGDEWLVQALVQQHDSWRCPSPTEKCCAGDLIPVFQRAGWKTSILFQSGRNKKKPKLQYRIFSRGLQLSLMEADSCIWFSCPLQ